MNIMNVMNVMNSNDSEAEYFLENFNVYKSKFRPLVYES